MAFADDLIKPQGGTQSTNLGEDINDPVLMKARAAQMKRDAIEKKDLENKSKRISADKAIDLRYELSILDRERENILMRIEDIGVEMEQTAEPEGGPIADKLGERLMAAERELRAINSKIIDIKDDLEIFDMNESELNEFGPMAGSGNRNYSTNDLVDRIGELDDILASDRKAENEWEQISQNYLDGERGSEYWADLGDQELRDAIDDAESLMKKHRMNESDLDEGTCGYTPDGEPRSKPAGPSMEEDLEVDVSLYSDDSSIFSRPKEKVTVNIPGDFNDNEGEIAVEKELRKQNKSFKSFKVKDIKELPEDINLNIDSEDANDEYAKEEDKVANSAAYESLRESLRKNLKKKLS